MPKLIIKIDKKKEQKYLKYIHDNLDKNLDYNKFTKKQDINKIKKNWEKIENKFFNLVKKEGKQEWKYKKYYAILSKITSFSYSSPFKEHRNFILIDSKLGKYTNRIICHELLHIYLSQIFGNFKKNEEILQELFVTHMLFDTNLNKIFRDKMTIKQNLLCAGHKKQYKIYKKSKKIWEKRNNIPDWIKQLKKILN